MAGRGGARVVVANRAQLSWDLINPDGWLAPDHRARLVVGFFETLDLTVLYDKIEAREGTAGRPAADPAVLFAVWVLATMDGVGSARELDRLTSQDLAYRWVACGVPVNYHGLADFRVAHADVLDGLLTKTLAAFMAEGLFDADEIVVDGTKIKASAGKSSYKRALRLDEAEAAAKGRVVALKAEVDADPAASSKRTQAARARGLRQTQERIEKARAKLAEIEAEKAERSKRSPKEVAEQKEARASLTDPQARGMRCAEGAGGADSDGRSNGCWRTQASHRLMILQPSAADPKRRSASTFIRPRIAPTSSQRRCWCGKNNEKENRRPSRTGGSAWQRTRQRRS